MRPRGRYARPRREPHPRDQRKRGEAPRYWWDFQWEGDKIVAIIIETTDPRVPTGIVERIPYHRGAINVAEERLKAWQEGRRTWTSQSGT